MRDAVRNKESWERRRTPTQYPSTYLSWIVEQFPGGVPGGIVKQTPKPIMGGQYA